jgi:hypothetical protein
MARKPKYPAIVSAKHKPTSFTLEKLRAAINQHFAARRDKAVACSIDDILYGTQRLCDSIEPLTLAAHGTEPSKSQS